MVVAGESKRPTSLSVEIGPVAYTVHHVLRSRGVIRIEILNLPGILGHIADFGVRHG